MIWFHMFHRVSPLLICLALNFPQLIVSSWSCSMLFPCISCLGVVLPFLCMAHGAVWLQGWCLWVVRRQVEWDLRTVRKRSDAKNTKYKQIIEGIFDSSMHLINRDITIQKSSLIPQLLMPCIYIYDYIYICASNNRMALRKCFDSS